MTLDAFEDVGPPPPARPEPELPDRTPCVGGPWSGAHIWHMRHETAPRTVRSNRDGPAQIAGQLLGEYRYVPPGRERAGTGATWRWHPFL